MSIRTALFCTALAAGAAFTPAPSFAGVNVDIDIAPPAPREEVVPAPRPGFIWIGGYWSWSGHKHEWVGGHWERERHGEHWVAPKWEQHGGRWHFDEGRWDHD